MIKYFCDRCGKEITYANGYTIPPRMKNDNGIMHHGGFFICNECKHRWDEVKDRISDIDFIEMSDKELQPYRCDFKIGDEVITKDGRVGVITDICTCDRCRERGFFEPNVHTKIGDSKIWITDYDQKDGFTNFYQIGHHRFGNLDEGSVSREIDDYKQHLLNLYAQLGTIKELQIKSSACKKKENTNEI